MFSTGVFKVMARGDDFKAPFAFAELLVMHGQLHVCPQRVNENSGVSVFMQQYCMFCRKLCFMH